MLNIIWLSLMVGSVLIGLIKGSLPEVITAITDSAKFAVTIAIAISGTMAFWTGLMKIAEHAGLTRLLANILSPALRVLFPGIPKGHPAMGAVLMNITANLLGLGNAATPFGIQAMQQLQTLNTEKETATDAMCMFLAINTSSIQLIPITTIAFLAAAGGKQPTAIVLSSLLATFCSTLVAIVFAHWFSRWRCFKVQLINNKAG